MLEDHDFLQWVRGATSKDITQRDVELAGDVRGIQLFLYSIARVLRAAKILEVGTADGSTTLPLLKAAEENDGFVTSIDPSNCEDAHRLVTSLGYDNIWKHHQKLSKDFYTELKNEDVFDLAFIDGDHTAVGVSIDLINVIPRLRPGGFCILHDWNRAEKSLIGVDLKKVNGNDVAAAVCNILPKFKPLVAFPLCPDLFWHMENKEGTNQAEGRVLVIVKPSDINEHNVLCSLGIY